MENPLEYAKKMVFTSKPKSNGLTPLVRRLFKLFPNKPQQPKYRQQLRNCLRLVLTHLIATDGFYSYSRGDSDLQYKTKKYSAKNIGKVVAFLESLGLVENCKGVFDPNLRRVSRIRRLPKLKNLFIEYQVSAEPIRIKPKSELIILRDEFKQDIPYRETAFTRSARGNVKLFNDLIADHSILDHNGNPIQQKYQHRIFNNSTF